MSQLTPIDILRGQLHAVKIIQDGRCVSTETPSTAAGFLTSSPGRYQPIVKAGRVRQLIDLIPGRVSAAPAWYPCYRNSQSPVIQPSPDWQHAVGYEVSL